MKILFIGNGKTDINININEYDKIYCVDGGFNLFIKKYNLFNKVLLIGDLDSINQKTLKKYEKKVKIVKKNNQNVSDLQFSLNYCLKNERNIKEIDFINVVSIERLDHSLCNILLLNQVCSKIKSKIITENEIVYLIDKKIELKNVLNKTISIIPLTNVKNINLIGFKWKLKNKNLKFGYINGISNIAIKNNVKITIDKGNLLVIINKVAI